MKLRIKGNSIRFRLGQSEVQRLASSGLVDESTTFDPLGTQKFIYKLVSTLEADAVAATFHAGTLTVSLPRAQAIAWASSDRIGIEAFQPSSNGSSLRILIEKDLECIDPPPEESQADAYRRASHGVACELKNA